MGMGSIIIRRLVIDKFFSGAVDSHGYGFQYANVPIMMSQPIPQQIYFMDVRICHSHYSSSKSCSLMGVRDGIPMC
jgi:hypothetical protein